MARGCSAASARPPPWKMLRLLALVCFTTVCAAQTPKAAPPPPSSATSKGPTLASAEATPAGKVATLEPPPTPRLRQVSAWLAVFPSERVVLRCELHGDGWRVIWLRDGHDLPPAGDPDLSLSEAGALLTITANASATYQCQGKHNDWSVLTTVSEPLEVSVHPNKPKPDLSRVPNFEEMFSGESVTFRCTLPVSGGWTYLWYHNGTTTPGGQNLTVASLGGSHSGQYQCRGQRGPDPFQTELSDMEVLLVNVPPTPSLTLLTKWEDVFPDEEVDLRCGVNDAAWTYTWYRNRQGLQLDPEEDDDSFNITKVQPQHQGSYSCQAHLRGISSAFSNTINITVHAPPIPRLALVPSHTPMYTGESLVLTCSVDVSSGWYYKWQKDGRDLAAGPADTLNVTLRGPADGGNYTCSACRGPIQRNTAAGIELVVHEIPIPLLVQMTPWLDVFPTESMKLACFLADADHNWRYSWHQDGEEVKAQAASFHLDRDILSISSATDQHAGLYQCRGHLPDRSVHTDLSPGLSLTVHDEIPSPELSRDPEYKLMFPGESVNFSCHTNISNGWEYVYYKDQRPLKGSGVFVSELTQASDGGSYTCVATRGTDPVFSTRHSPHVLLDVKGEKPKPLMTQEPKADKVYVGESVTLECKVEIFSSWEYLWTKDQVPLTQKSHILSIQHANLSDSGTYECLAQRDRSTYQSLLSDGGALQILEIPVPKLKVAQLLDVFPTESVKMSCGMEEGTSHWTYTWYKDGKVVQADHVVSLGVDGTTLTISSAATKHAGQYRCSGMYKSRSVHSTWSSGETLSVYDSKPRVTVQTLQSDEVLHTGDAVFLGCHVNVSSGWQYMWYKDNRPLTQRHDNNNHSIGSVQTGNSGSYTCRVQRKGNTVFESDQSPEVNLNVQERPQAQIILLTGWSDVFSTDTLVLACSVQDGRDMWNYTWFREGEPLALQPSDSRLLRVTPQNDPQQSLYTCQGNHNERPTYSDFSDSFRTKNLLLKRRVLLSISGCLFFGLIAVFLGCIVLRLTRKPADHDETPEEENLFLTMAQLKDHTETPNPLAEYITDDSLNAPAQETETNGDVCNETTPLPITPTNEQGERGEGEGLDESNGGLVSFKQ